MRIGTYVYCLVAAPRRPSARRMPKERSGLGPVRLLAIDAGEWLVVSDAPLDRFGEAAINERLSDLDWVARIAVVHEAVIESFIAAPAVLPMKLFTIFTSDERALAHVRGDRPRIDALLRRVRGHQEWGVRVVLDRARAIEAAARAVEAPRRRAGTPSGTAYLSRKKAQRDSASELAAHARERVAAVYDRLSSRAHAARRRLPGDMPIADGPLLLDAAFLVPSRSAARFRAAAATEARALEAHGYAVTLTGPWPPYSFVQD